MNIFNIKNAYEHKKRKKWNRLYWIIDYHDTISPGGPSKGDNRVFYPNACKVLQYLSILEDTVIILYTHSSEDDIKDICKWLKKYDIEFDYINENPEVNSPDRDNKPHKLYSNIILDNTAGFEGETDWFLVESELKEALKL